jgi:hypothetical protein
LGARPRARRADPGRVRRAAHDARHRELFGSAIAACSRQA